MLSAADRFGGVLYRPQRLQEISQQGDANLAETPTGKAAPGCAVQASSSAEATSGRAAGAHAHYRGAETRAVRYGGGGTGPACRTGCHSSARTGVRLNSQRAQILFRNTEDRNDHEHRVEQPDAH